MLLDLMQGFRTPSLMMSARLTVLTTTPYHKSENWLGPGGTVWLAPTPKLTRAFWSVRGVGAKFGILMEGDFEAAYLGKSDSLSRPSIPLRRQVSCKCGAMR